MHVCCLTPLPKTAPCKLPGQPELPHHPITTDLVQVHHHSCECVGGWPLIHRATGHEGAQVQLLPVHQHLVDLAKAPSAKALEAQHQRVGGHLKACAGSRKTATATAAAAASAQVTCLVRGSACISLQCCSSAEQGTVMPGLHQAAMWLTCVSPCSAVCIHHRRSSCHRPAPHLQERKRQWQLAFALQASKSWPPHPARLNMLLLSNAAAWASPGSTLQKETSCLPHRLLGYGRACMLCLVHTPPTHKPHLLCACAARPPACPRHVAPPAAGPVLPHSACLPHHTRSTPPGCAGSRQTHGAPEWFPGSCTATKQA